MRRTPMRQLIFNIALILLLGTVPRVAVAQLRPGIPEEFHGRTTGIAGEHVSAIIGGVTVASTTIEPGEVYGYAPHLFLVTDPDNTRRGAVVAFRIGTTSVAQTAVFTNGAITALDLLLPGTVLDEPATTSATTTASSTPEESDDTSSTTITIATSTAPGSASSSGTQGGSLPLAATENTHSAAVPSRAPQVETRGADAPQPGQSPIGVPSATAPAPRGAGRLAPVEELGERDSEAGAMPVEGSVAPYSLAAAIVLATSSTLEPLLVAAAYLGAAVFFAYALLYRLRLRRRG